MTLQVDLIDEEILIKEIVNEMELEFDYVKMINALFNKENVELKFTDKINVEDKKSIENMFVQINNISSKKDK